MNKFQSFAAQIIEEVRAAEIDNIDNQDPQESEVLIRERLEVFLRENLPALLSSGPDDYLSVPDPSANLNLGNRWDWKPSE